MANIINVGIVGCGDFLRWQADDLANSKQLKVAKLFDPRREEAEKYAAKLGGVVVDSEDAIFNDPSISVVALFVPPWIRAGLLARAAQAGKHVITTKPLGPTEAECEGMVESARKAGIKAGVIYSRTGDPFIETAKQIFESGRFGKLALYRQDWIHAYPKWNKWAVDPDKNGGPFMDAMIHNLNTANYLMGRPLVERKLYSDNLAHPDLRCADTEFMVTRYEGGGVAHLFITWAADLATHSTAGNDREHIDVFYMVTDKGWRLTKEWRENGCFLVASREGKKEEVLVAAPAQTCYDGFAAHIAGGAFPRVLATLSEAAADIATVRKA